MTVAGLAGLAPARIASTVVATEGLSVSPDIAKDVFQHSGNPYGSVMQVLGAAPRVRYSTPFAEAWTVFGSSLKPKAFTTWDVYFSSFASGVRDSASTHVKLALTASCSVFAWIRSISCRDRGV
jgi:hypothetical protein